MKLKLRVDKTIAVLFIQFNFGADTLITNTWSGDSLSVKTESWWKLAKISRAETTADSKL